MRMESLSHSKTLKVLALVAFVLGASAQAQTAVQDGHAYLMVEDFKTLLGAFPRDPSSEAKLVELAATPSTQDGVEGGRALQIRLVGGEVARLRKEIRSLEIQRGQLAAKLAQETDAKKVALRNERRALQAARLSARSDRDATLGKSLFESLLQEANLDARVQRELAAFDEAHAIEVSFREDRGVKLVNSVRIADEIVWSRNTARSATTVAAR